MLLKWRSKSVWPAASSPARQRSSNAMSSISVTRQRYQRIGSHAAILTSSLEVISRRHRSQSPYTSGVRCYTTPHGRQQQEAGMVERQDRGVVGGGEEPRDDGVEEGRDGFEEDEGRRDGKRARLRSWSS